MLLFVILGVTVVVIIDVASASIDLLQPICLGEKLPILNSICCVLSLGKCDCADSSMSLWINNNKGFVAFHNLIGKVRTKPKVFVGKCV